MKNNDIKDFPYETALCDKTKVTVVERYLDFNSCIDGHYRWIESIFKRM